MHILATIIIAEFVLCWITASCVDSDDCRRSQQRESWAWGGRGRISGRIPFFQSCHHFTVVVWNTHYIWKLIRINLEQAQEFLVLGAWVLKISGKSTFVLQLCFFSSTTKMDNSTECFVRRAGLRGWWKCNDDGCGGQKGEHKKNHHLHCVLRGILLWFGSLRVL